MRDALNRGEDPARLLAVGPFSAHDCASLLKAFLSELPEPLLSEQQFSVHRLAVGMACYCKMKHDVHCNVGGTQKYNQNTLYK